MKDQPRSSVEVSPKEPQQKAGQRNIIRPRTVMERLDIKSRVTVWSRVRAGTLPAPVNLGGGQIGFYEDEIDELINDLPRVNYATGQAKPAAPTAGG